MTHRESSRKFVPDDLVLDLRLPALPRTHLEEKKAYADLHQKIWMQNSAYIIVY